MVRVWQLCGGPRPGPRLAGYTYFRLSRSAFNWAYCSVAIQAFAASIEAKTGCFS